MIGGFEFPDGGEVFIGGEPMGNRPPYRRDSSMVFQNYALFPHMSVADNVAYGLREQRVEKATIRQRVEEMLRLVELPDYGNRRPKQLSGGQQQRVALARSLVIAPTVLLLDEPLGALDLKLRKQMQFEIKRIQERTGITFIYVTHDQEEALAMSNRIVVMNQGRIEQAGTVEEVFERPRTRFVADFMGAENLLDGEVLAGDAATARLRVAGKTLQTPASGLREGERVTVMVRPEKLRLLPDHGVDDGEREASWPATVVSRIYKGSFLAYQLELADGEMLVAEIARDGNGHRFEQRDTVHVALSAADAVVIPTGSASA
jgi:ABC-type Fe3+/spermidine/putrescine transport system ATPase subunit